MPTPTTSLPSESAEPSPGTAATEAPPAEAPPVATPWASVDPEIVSCMVSAARAAYAEVGEVPETICGDLLEVPFEVDLAHSGSVVKTYTRRLERDPLAVEVLLAFAGTRQNAGDIARDLQSQVLAPYENHYAPEVPGGVELTGDERVASGFDARWDNQAASVREGIDAARDQAGGALTVHLAGHSLGAATATRAAFDIARGNAGDRVLVWSFNAPHVGNVPFARAYATSLGPCAAISRGCLNLHQFTRAGDLVHAVPLRAHHPVWNESTDEARRQNAGEPSQIELHACSHYHAPRASLLAPAENHDLDRWLGDLQDMPPDHLECMLL